MGHGAHFLADLVIVLGAAAVATVLFHALRLPLVLGYILAGLIIGPHVPVPLVADPALVGALSELGVILLMFSIGTELDLGKLARVGPQAGVTAAIEVGLMVTLGYLLGQTLGWTATECLFLGGIVGVSSTMLVARSFAERRPDPAVAELVFAILVFEDILAILLLAVLTAVASGAGLSAGDVARTSGELAGFLAALLFGGLLVVPRLIRLVARTRRDETLLITALGVCFAMAYLAELAGYSVALGAFIAGMLVAESGQRDRIEALVHPLRDLFAAIFFVAVGMTIDPRLIADGWVPAVAATALVIGGKLFGVSIGAVLAGTGLRRAVQAGMSLAQIGELSFVIAGLGVSSGVTGPGLLAVAVAVSCATALATPWMARGGDRFAGYVDARLPRPLQTFITLYGAWIDRMRQGPERDSRWRRIRRPVVGLVVEGGLLAATVIGTALVLPRAWPRLDAQLGVGRLGGELIVGGAGGAVAALFLISVLRRARRLGQTLAAEVIPHRGDGQLDLGTAPRRVLVAGLELVAFLAIGLPVAAVVQPFFPEGGAIVLAVALGLAALGWRSLTNLQGHVRAGSELIVEALAKARGAPAPPRLDQVEAMLPGLSGLTSVRLAADAP
ncbi:MAG: cation:proton antiporter, partial [Myxococcales bacterium]|nr:cation:proton antiporter [Myxococcales bacterium]